DLRPGLSENAALARLTSRSASSAASGVRSAESAEAAKLERKVFSMLNRERRSQGLSELEWNDEVAAVARLHSHNMAEAKFFSHRGTDGSMVDGRADRIGLGSWRTIGENIAYIRGYEDPAALAVEKWMESTAHRKNLLGPNWKESAVGVAITSDGTYYLTQVFLLRK
ncbi:MAG TPA: CAP domain-containing protein, partial [Pyrinomonadaceae bacterium]